MAEPGVVIGIEHLDAVAVGDEVLIHRDARDTAVDRVHPAGIGAAVLLLESPVRAGDAADVCTAGGGVAMACKRLMQHVERAAALWELIELAGEPLAAVIAEGEVRRVQILNGLVARGIGAGHLKLDGDGLIHELAQALVVRVFLCKLREALT